MNEKLPESFANAETKLPLSTDPYRSFTLPSSYYLDPQVFDLEKPRIFYKSWHYVAHQNSLARVGDYASAVIGDERVFVIRGKDNKLRAFYNVCRHRAHHLVEGCGNTRAIVCPYHAWCYELDGSLYNAPQTQDLPDFNRANFGLKSIALDVLSGLILVNLDPSATTVDDSAPGLRADLEDKLPWLSDANDIRDCTFGGASMNANWKVVVDNFIECYHCQHSHPAFADMISMSDYEHDLFDGWARQLGPKTKAESTAYNFPSDTDVPRAMFWYVWPSFTINVVPGFQLANVLSVNPIDHEHTAFAGQAISAQAGDIPDRLYEYLYEELGAEDQGLCESVQQGLKSRAYDQGPFVVDKERSGVSEHALHDFHLRVLEALN